jgi:hypothetical protein
MWLCLQTPINAKTSTQNPGDHVGGSAVFGEDSERRHVAKGESVGTDITFARFAPIYIRDYADLHQRSVDRDREILKVLTRAFGGLILHEITAHRIVQFKRERLAGKWRGHGQTSAAKPIKPATVNRELDCL